MLVTILIGLRVFSEQLYLSAEIMLDLVTIDKLNEIKLNKNAFQSKHAIRITHITKALTMH